METWTSVSGGKTSAYLAANFPSDRLVFALVRIEDQRCAFPDLVVRRQIEDRIQAPFVGTAEEDMIIYTMLDLEQYLGREIKFVTGITYEQVIANKGGWLPNKTHRYCTTWMKIIPIFEYWLSLGIDPVKTNIGYRANEKRRVKKMNDKRNENGLIGLEYSLEKHVGGAYDGKNKWETIYYSDPQFPLYDGGIYKDTIEEYWKGKPVRFAKKNNCVGCFHRNPLLLREYWDLEPEKMNWFAEQEKPGKGTWRSDVSYFDIKKHKPQLKLSFQDVDDECDDGFCEIN